MVISSLMSAESDKSFPMPVFFQGWPVRDGLVETEGDLSEAIFNKNPFLTDQQVKATSHLFRRMVNNIFQKGRFPEEVVASNDKHDNSTHVLVGSLLRKHGVYISFCYQPDSGFPLSIISIPRDWW